MSLSPCPFCKLGNLQVVYVNYTYTYNKVTGIVAFKEHLCNSCGAKVQPTGVLNDYNLSVIEEFEINVNKQYNNVIVYENWRK